MGTNNELSWKKVVLAALGAGVIVVGCTVESKDTSDDDDDSSSTGTTTGTTTGAGGTSASTGAGPTTTGPGPTTTTGAGGSGGGTTCSPVGGTFDDPANGFGDAACEACAVAACACEYEAYEANMETGATALDSCVTTSCAECFYPICTAQQMGNAIGFYYNSGCANCLGTNCCTETQNCIDDAQCWACISGGVADPDNDPSCTGNSAWMAQDSCEANNCATAATCGE